MPSLLVNVKIFPQHCDNWLLVLLLLLLLPGMQVPCQEGLEASKHHTGCRAAQQQSAASND
jgi:hypothetical protein